jgi:hypothetical protein
MVKQKEKRWVTTREIQKEIPTEIPMEIPMEMPTEKEKVIPMDLQKHLVKCLEIQTVTNWG